MRLGALQRLSIAVGVVLGSIASRAVEAHDLPEIKKQGVLRVLAVLSAEERYFISDTPRGGFDWEVLEGFAQLHNLKLTLIPISGWDGLVTALVAEKGDVIAGGFTDTEARRKLIHFTGEIFPTRAVVVTRRPSPPVLTLDDLKAQHVGTLRGSFMYDDLLASGVAAAKIDDSIPTGGIPRALAEGRITAGVDGIEAALVAIAKGQDLQIGMFLGRPASLAYGVRKGDGRLIAELDRYVANVRHTATWSRLAVKYFGASAPDILKKARGD